MNADAIKKKLWWSWISLRNPLRDLAIDLYRYYISPYPLLRIMGTIHRIIRRLRSIWLPKSPGRPPVSESIVDIILDMKRHNWSWGALRISNELKAMGIRVSKRTVAKILRDNGMLPPKTRFTPPNWRATADAFRWHLAMDFTYIFDRNGLQLFIFNIIDCTSRQLLVCAPTYNPTNAWIIQQFRNAFMEHVGDPPRFMIHDNDALFKHWLSGVLHEFGLESKPITQHCPWENGRVERFHHSLKFEVLSRLPIANNAHAMAICAKYKRYYNSRRTHQALAGQSPCNSTVAAVTGPTFSVKKCPRVDGLITDFRLAA